MSYTFTCDWCGGEIESVRRAIKLRAEAGEDTDWRGGWAADYHPDCMHDVMDAIDLIRGVGKFVDSIPVREKLVEQEKPRPTPRPTTTGRPSRKEWDRRVAAGTRLHKLGFGPAVVHRLYQANLLTLEEVAERTEEEVAAIRGVGFMTMQRLRAALANARLSFRRDSEAVV